MLNWDIEHKSLSHSRELWHIMFGHRMEKDHQMPIMVCVVPRKSESATAGQEQGNTESLDEPTNASSELDIQTTQPPTVKRGRGRPKKSAPDSTTSEKQVEVTPISDNATEPVINEHSGDTESVESPVIQDDDAVNNQSDDIPIDPLEIGSDVTDGGEEFHDTADTDLPGAVPEEAEDDYDGVTFVKMLEQQLKSRRRRLPQSFYGDDTYSSVDNEKLPEGCKSLMDFFNIPKNFDFKALVDVSTQSSLSGRLEDTDLSRSVSDPRYTGKFDDSFFEHVFKPKPHNRRYSTSEGEPESCDLDQVYDRIKGKGPSELMPPEKQSPLDRIGENYLMFDDYGYLRHYISVLNRYNYRALSSHHRRDTTLNYYLNNEYIQRMRTQFPPRRDHTDRVRAHFMAILPEIMDNLVNLIRNDPNKDRTPSPPLHDMTLAPGFSLPDYMTAGYETDDDRESGFNESDYLRFSSLKGLHEPERYLSYPYADLEPLYQRQLLSLYLEILKSGDLGPPETYKKFKSHAASIRNELYQDQTKLPQEVYKGGQGLGKEPLPPLDEPVKFTKVYERGSRKTSVAVVYLEPGNGHIIINDRDGYQYVRYCTHRLREILEPLDSIYAYKRFNIVARVNGGGISGQSGAIRHALCRYISRVLAPKLDSYLSMRGLGKADTRQVERKKTNLRKARKKEHYSKR
uniref:Ribosomal protein S9, putative n=1 Tax=Babesia bovis TaxID=5865 RepID=A7ANP2_BABBO|eukprot:XP_001611744.1 ribosomal protein S9 [Babesia bovis T2Bo]